MGIEDMPKVFQSDQKPKGTSDRPPNYISRTHRAIFFVDGLLYRRIRVSRPTDMIEAYCYATQQRKYFIWSEIKKNEHLAFGNKIVAQMLGTSVKYLKLCIVNELIPTPARAYPADPEDIGDYWKERGSRMYWTREQILQIHSFMTRKSRGQFLTKDGRKNYEQRKRPTRAELIAMLDQEEMTYVKRGNEFYPVWLAKE